ncbi:PhzF family phenazine biosynthesis protein [Patescibacteria group bacterium]|nr:PhzF family phenazine biosynthesis protein [Patescibacteria group bacterium]
MRVLLTILRVFTDPGGNFGNPVGIVSDADKRFSGKTRQNIATRLGFSESVFIDDAAGGRVAEDAPRSITV